MWQKGWSPLHGIICLWSGTLDDIPDGWLLCDGSNGTPNLTDKFVRGPHVDRPPHTQGGSSTHKHNVSADPDEHSHTLSVSDDSHTHPGVAALDTHNHTGLTDSDIHTHPVNCYSRSHAHLASSADEQTGLPSGLKLIDSEPDGHFDTQDDPHQHLITVEPDSHNHYVTLDADPHDHQLLINNDIHDHLLTIDQVEHRHLAQAFPDAHSHVLNEDLADHIPPFYVLAYIMKL